MIRWICKVCSGEPPCFVEDASNTMGRPDRCPWSSSDSVKSDFEEIVA